MTLSIWLDEIEGGGGGGGDDDQGVRMRQVDGFSSNLGQTSKHVMYLQYTVATNM